MKVVGRSYSRSGLISILYGLARARPTAAGVSVKSASSRHQRGYIIRALVLHSLVGDLLRVGHQGRFNADSGSNRNPPEYRPPISGSYHDLPVIAPDTSAGSTVAIYIGVRAKSLNPIFRRNKDCLRLVFSFMKF